MTSYDVIDLTWSAVSNPTTPLAELNSCLEELNNADKDYELTMFSGGSSTFYEVSLTPAALEYVVKTEVEIATAFKKSGGDRMYDALTDKPFSKEESNKKFQQYVDLLNRLPTSAGEVEDFVEEVMAPCHLIYCVVKDKFLNTPNLKSRLISKVEFVYDSFADVIQDLEVSILVNGVPELTVTGSEILAKYNEPPETVPVKNLVVPTTPAKTAKKKKRR